MRSLSTRLLSCLGAVMLWLCSSPSAMATQATHVEVSEILTVPIYLTTVPTTIETQLTSSSGDTYLRILDSTGTNEVAGNDDNGDVVCSGFFCFPDSNSRVTFTPPSPGIYLVMVHSKTQTEAGHTDVFVNGAQFVNDLPFGGEMVPIDFAQNEWFRATAQSREPGCNRAQLYLVQGPYSFYLPPKIVEGDRNYNGPNFDAFFEVMSSPNSSFPRHALVGLASYPNCATGTSPVLFTIDENPSTMTDSDGDDLSNSLENDLSTDPFDEDSDDDGISDYLEALGNDGLSYATGGYHLTMGPTPATTRNIYVEVLQMLDRMGGNEYAPPVDYAQELAATFENDSDDGIQIEWLGVKTIPHTDILAMEFHGLCTPASNCVTVSDLKSTYFNDPSKQAHVHVGFLSDLIWEVPGSSGYAEVGGNDFIVSSQALRNTSTTQAIYDDKFRGLFLHELGHNLGLTHNYNDNQFGQPWSQLHGSVMNYLYTNQGVGIPSGPYTYSTGTYDTNGDLVCNPCGTSSKGYCAHLRNTTGCVWYYSGGQAVEHPCDCDIDEWSDALHADLRPAGALFWSDGPSGETAANSEGPFDTWVLPPGTYEEVPRVTHADRRAHVDVLRRRLSSLDLIEGTDYTCSTDQTRCFMD